MKTPISLETFYSWMKQAHQSRKTLYRNCYRNEKPKSTCLDQLKEIYNRLTNFPTDEKGFLFQTSEKETIFLKLDYEINELEKDLFYLQHTHKEFIDYLSDKYDHFIPRVNSLQSALNSSSWKNFITDRDGTINNYCGRYLSSMQSVYNAVFLRQFIKRSTQNAVIITSAPLKDTGLYDLSLLDTQDVIYAGSKAREYLDSNGVRHHLPIKPEQSMHLEALNKDIKLLLERQEYKVFSHIGSALQFKFGQTAVARQDINQSITKEKSLQFLEEIRTLVLTHDPTHDFFRIEDTGLDIEIHLTVTDNSHSDRKAKDFDKGDGLLFLNDQLQLNIQEGNCLICGDTSSDLPMVREVKSLNHQMDAVIVTENAELKEKTRQLYSPTHFVDCPDILVTALYLLST